MYEPTYFSAHVCEIFVSADAVSYVFQTQRLSPFSVYYIGAICFYQYHALTVNIPEVGKS